MRHQRHTLLVAALALAVIAVVPGGAVAAGSVSVTGDQAADGTVTVTVTENNTTVTNATVTVEALNNSSYVDEGDHTTDQNGTVELAAPEENVSVTVTTSVNDTTAETTLDLVAPTDDSSDLAVDVTQAEDGTGTVAVTNGSGAGVANATVTVEALNNSSYVDEGDHTTDENGTVGLSAPEENVTVEVVADANNETASTTTTLTVAANDSEGTLSFGERVSSFVDQLRTDGNMSGQQVATFVVSNNPGADNRPDHVDPGPPDDDDEDDERGNGDGADGNNGNGADGNDGNDADGNDGNGDGASGNASDDGDDDNGNGNNGNSNGSSNGNGNGNGNADAMSGLP
ncbi:hypothetical protein [Halobacterium bonnevillei]|uniref:Uncharacterized protein n=1 Tax=Halobacterium bonnevillei TaxID=2692200 RepID=A0A6B0SQA6_9EURY|nr:hypothetical protein [Halobacterium bonnevillei]MXR21771.1 hypothetical protein [Halobacterium bonnevillei]